MRASILVADDHGLIRQGLRRVIDAAPDFEVCGEASDGEELLHAMEGGAPDVVVLDIAMPGMSGLETLERIRRRHPEVKVLLLSVHGDTPYVQSAVSLGADGYVLKNAGSEEILSALRSVLEGRNYYSPAVAKEVVRQLRSPDAQLPDPYALLSKREREVLLHIADGLSAKQIARRLEISTKTVEAHRTSLMRKLGVRKATELVRYAFQHGFVRP